MEVFISIFNMTRRELMKKTIKVAFYDTKPYDRVWFDKMKDMFPDYPLDIMYFEMKLNEKSASTTAGYDVVCAFVNDDIDASVIDTMVAGGVKLLAMRCAGYNNIDFQEAFGKLHVVRVPAYSPYAVAEFAMALLLEVARRLQHAYVRTREFNFTLSGLVGFDLHGKTVGVIGTGKIGRVFIDICKGFGMNVIAYDPYPAADLGVPFVSVEELCKQADIISLHCPLTPQTKHLINAHTLSLMKDGVYIINTSRGALIESEALLEAIKSKKVGGAGLDVYEEEGDLFYEDMSSAVVTDDVLAVLISQPNVVVTGHQAFLTNEALQNIAEATITSIKQYFADEPLPNEICYNCIESKHCAKDHVHRCF